MLFGDDQPGESPLSVLSSEEVIVRLAERASPEAALAFDADGTLWSGDIGVDAFEALLEQRGVRPLALAALRAEAESFSVETSNDPNDQAERLYQAFKRGVYPEGRAFPMMAWVFAGYREDEVRAFASELVERVALGARVHGEVLPVVGWAVGQSIERLVVSASPIAIVEVAIERLALPMTGLFAMSPAVEHGVVQPRVLEPVTYGAGKIAALRAGAPGRALLGAFGDSVFDLPMLCQAEIAVAVRPKPELRARAASCPGLIELAPRVR
jgi:phosphatidylglycerophosphatase C